MNSDDSTLPGKPMTFAQHFLPCGFCMRNPQVQELLATNTPLAITEFPDGTKPHAIPLDCYMTEDMHDHYMIRERAAVEAATQAQTRSAVSEIAKEYGVDLPPHEVDL